MIMQVIFLCFTGNCIEQETIHYAVCYEWYSYTLNNNKLVISLSVISSIGGVRDSYVLRGDDGKTFFMVQTDMAFRKMWNSNCAMVLLKFDNLVDWKHSTDLTCKPSPLFLPAYGKSCIDGDIIYKDGVFHMFYKTEKHGGGIKDVTSESLISDEWSEYPDYKQQTEDAFEGSCTFKLIGYDKYILIYNKGAS